MRDRSGIAGSAGVTRRDAMGLAIAATAFSFPSRARAAVAPSLRRGVSLHRLLNWPDTTDTPDGVDYVWPPFQGGAYSIGQSDLLLLLRQGFDFIRLTVDPSIVMSTGGDRRQVLFAIIRRTVERLVSAGFSVVVDLHPVAVNPRYEPGILVAKEHGDLFERYVEAAADVARLLNTLSSRGVALELMNEPLILEISDLPRWQTMLERLHAQVRAAAADLPLVLTGAQWSSLDALLHVDPAPFRGSTVFYTFHYYDPHTFTHQGVKGEDAQYISGLRWPARPGEAAAVVERAASQIETDVPADQRGAKVAETRDLVRDYLGTPSGPEMIERRFAAVHDWAVSHAIAPERILLGEFGGGWGASGSPAAMADTMTWLRSVRSAAEHHHFAWAYWAYDKPLSGDLLAALGMKPNSGG